MPEWMSTYELVAPLVVAGAYVVFLAAEHFFPLRERTRPFGGRLLTNAVMTALTFGTGALLVRTTGLGLARWASAGGIGLLHVLGLPAPLGIAAGFLLMDLTFYYWHRANHTFRVLWRFHNAHHIDPDLDVTTGFRFHFGEVALSTGFRAVQVVIIGVSPLLYVTYELAFQLATLFHHSNLRLPIGLERVVNKVMVTPRMHGIHHSVVRNETNSNYSVIFRFWDYLHRTLVLCVPQSWIRIGVPNYLEPGDNRPGSVLLMPFRSQRVYFRRKSGVKPTRDWGEEPPEPARLAE